MRLPVCTRPVAGTSSMCMNTRGAMLKKLVPRSGSSVSTAATRKLELPSCSFEPTGAASALISRSSIHTLPRGGPDCAGASAALGTAAMRSRPRSG